MPRILLLLLLSCALAHTALGARMLSEASDLDACQQSFVEWIGSLETCRTPAKCCPPLLSLGEDCLTEVLNSLKPEYVDTVIALYEQCGIEVTSQRQQVIGAAQPRLAVAHRPMPAASAVHFRA